MKVFEETVKKELKVIKLSKNFQVQLTNGALVQLSHSFLQLSPFLTQPFWKVDMVLLT